MQHGHARSNSVCTLGSQEVGKLTLPSLSSCWVHALVVSNVVMRLAPIIRYFDFMANSPMENVRARDGAGPSHRQERRRARGSEMPADGIKRRSHAGNGTSASPVSKSGSSKIYTCYP